MRGPTERKLRLLLKYPAMPPSFPRIDPDATPPSVPAPHLAFAGNALIDWPADSAHGSLTTDFQILRLRLRAFCLLVLKRTDVQICPVDILALLRSTPLGPCAARRPLARVFQYQIGHN